MAEAPDSSSASTYQSSHEALPAERPAGSVGGRRWIWLLVSGVCFAVATLTAFLQSPRGNPFRPQTALEWFKEPIERNSRWRLPSVTNNLTCVSFPDKRHGWAVGDLGTILATRDGGATWKPQSSGTSIALGSVYFTDPSRGWAVGGGGTILATSDGGNSWKPQTSGTSYWLGSVYFTDPSRGWAVGRGGTIVATSDGGNTWRSQISGMSQPPLTSVHFIDASLGWAVGDDGTILATRDGGANWKPQTSGFSRTLWSVYFADPSHGWVVGDADTILATSDGGDTWKPQTSSRVLISSSLEWLTSVHFADASRGWAVGGLGTILATSDGGNTWKPQTSDIEQPLRSVQFTDASVGWAVGDDGTILSTSDGGNTWKPQTSTTLQSLASVYFGDANRGWAVGAGGTILATSNGGNTWKPQTSGTLQSLASVHFGDANRGRAVGDEGTILATNDGGTTWNAQTSGTSSRLWSVDFADAGHGCAVGDAGTILATGDGGSSWQPRTSGTSQPLRSVHFADANHGWAVGDGGTILATNDGGTTWNAQTSGTSSRLWSVDFADAGHGWAVGDAGTTLATGDGGSNWQPRTSGTSQPLRSVHFANAERGWAAGDEGTILSTGDGGKTWRPQISGTSQLLTSVHFADAERGWAVVNGATILATSDSGEHWHGPAPPSRYPAPWYYMAVLLCLLIATPALRPVTVLRPTDSAANRQVSDNPIGPGDLDALGLSEIALGLSQFFRNIDTKPPLTVGVLGEWGQGKSSVMRLLEADLKKNGVYPVWFNAWHYQKEDHLLAYLLEAIRKQAVPRLHTLQGLRFRAGLLGLRATRSRWTLATLVIVLAFCAGLLRHPEASVELTKWLGNWRNWTSAPGGQLTILGISLGTALLFFKQLYEALDAFHVNPAALIKEAAGSASIKDLGAKTNLRAAFAKEFRDVTRALEPYRMVIFIDDLDRCNPRSVTQILESVNFLTSAGDCFIVMGLAKPQVEASVGLSFKDVAEELGDAGDAKKKRRDYAQHYLRKLINLEVKVPTATPAQQGVLLSGRKETDLPKPRTYAERLGDFGRANRPLAWLLGTAVLASVSLWFGLNMKIEEPATPAPTVIAQAPPPQAKPEKNPLPAAPETNLPREDRGSTIFVPGIPEARRFAWFPVLPAVLLLGFSFWVLTRRPNEIIQDSKNFTDALEIWRPVIGQQYKTPREIKRFLNRVRYIAMRWRIPSAQKAPFERIADWLQSKVKRTKPDRVKVTEINEARIVFMATLEGLGGEHALPARPGTDIAKALDEHALRLGEPGDDWRRYREITGEVEAN